MESTPILLGKELVFSALDGGVYFYDTETGELKNKMFAGSPIIGSPVITDDAIFTADFDGHITKFSK